MLWPINRKLVTKKTLNILMMQKIYERKVVEQGEFIKFLVFFKIGKGTTKKKS